MATDPKIEEEIEDWAKSSLKKAGIEYYIKTAEMSADIEYALKKAPSKKGGSGGNKPDVRFYIDIDGKKIPVMMECKGSKNALKKLDEDGKPANTKNNGEPNYQNIDKYAVNGAIHYADAVFRYADSYSKIIAVGVNGYERDDKVIREVSAWLISKDNYGVPKNIGDYDDLSIFYQNNRASLSRTLEYIVLTDEEREKKARESENNIELNLKRINQTMHDDLQIAVGDRVELIAAMIMAGLGVREGEDKVLVPGLEVEELKGLQSKNGHDGYIIYNKVSDFLEQKELPADKRESIKNTLERVLLHSNLEKKRKIDEDLEESKLKTVYREVKQSIMPLFVSGEHLDFTGRLFNVLNAWVDIPDGEKNDVVLTPRYVTEFMAKLAEVNMNSYVWDYAAGSGGFLISAMKLMLKDAADRYGVTSEKYLNKVSDIKKYQLLGCEIRPDIYLLAVLNMILMKDGSANLLNLDSLKNFTGTYGMGDKKGQDFPADTFLLNPPYSAPGKGFIFVEKALSRMKKGRACVLIQENAGSGNGLPYTKDLLKKNTLVASIHMSDIFRGKASVQPAVYVFDVGIAHDPNKYVKFVDFSDDGYTRQNRKKSGQEVNLRNTGDADGRYQEVLDLVLGRKHIDECKYFDSTKYIEDRITLDGDDWTFNQHRVIDPIPKEEDFKKVVADYLAWKVSQVIRGGEPSD